MKHYINLIIFSLLLYSCNEGRNSKVKMIELRDSLGVIMQQGQLNNDTVLLKKALSYCDYLLETDKEHAHHFNYYRNKSVIYSLLGQKEEAWDNMEKTMLMLETDNIDRLKFNCVKYIRENNKDSIDYYFKRAFAICENKLSTDWNENDVLSKTELLLYQGKLNEAKTYLEKEFKKKPDNMILKTAVETWEEWSLNTIAELNSDTTARSGGYVIMSGRKMF